MVPEAGIEPARYYYPRILSPVRLPVPSLGLQTDRPKLVSSLLRGDKS